MLGKYVRDYNLYTVGSRSVLALQTWGRDGWVGGMGGWVGGWVMMMMMKDYYTYVTWSTLC